QTHLERAEGEHLPARPAVMLRRSDKQDTHLGGRVGEVVVGVSPHRRDPLPRGRQPRDDPHRGLLAGAGGPDEPGDRTRTALERDVVDGERAVVDLGQAFYFDHGTIVARTRWAGHRKYG